MNGIIFIVIDVAVIYRDWEARPTKSFMVKLIEDETVICDVTQERTHGRRVGWCKDIADALIRAGPARDCPRYSGGRYASVEQPAARDLPFPGYCEVRVR